MHVMAVLTLTASEGTETRFGRKIWGPIPRNFFYFSADLSSEKLRTLLTENSSLLALTSEFWSHLRGPIPQIRPEYPSFFSDKPHRIWPESSSLPALTSEFWSHLRGPISQIRSEFSSFVSDKPQKVRPESSSLLALTSEFGGHVRGPLPQLFSDYLTHIRGLVLSNY